MHSVRTLPITILLAATLLGATFPTANEPAAMPASNRVESVAETSASLTVHADDERGRRVVKWAVGRYREAGLTVPASDVYFNRGLDACRGYVGLHTLESGRHRIDICDPGRRSRERIILHEFAHAWVGENLTDVGREGFVTLRGLETWYDVDTDWKLRGTEHAAEIMFWGLSEQCRTPGRIGTDEPAVLAVAFEFLTGTQPLCMIDPDGSSSSEPAATERRGGRTA